MADNYMPTFANFKDPVTGQWIAFPALKGDPGTPGKDGYTPTEEEITSIVNEVFENNKSDFVREVIDELPLAEGEEY